MLHELLLALSGDSGGIFVHERFAGLQVCCFADCKINVLGANFEEFASFNILVIIWRLAYLQVAADLPFLHDSEVNLLNRICKLGTYFQRFLAFCKKYSDVSPFIRENSRDGKFYRFNPNFTFVCFVLFFFCLLGLGLWLDLNCLK